jgi:hypothetical protein
MRFRAKGRRAQLQTLVWTCWFFNRKFRPKRFHQIGSSYAGTTTAASVNNAVDADDVDDDVMNDAERRKRAGEVEAVTDPAVQVPVLPKVLFFA